MSLREAQTPALSEHIDNLRQEEMLPAGSTALVPIQTPDNLAEAIRRSHNEYEASVCKAGEKAIETGRLLIEAKKRFRHGDWEEYVAQTFPFTMRTAQRYMRAAKQSLRPGNDSLSFLKRRKAAKIIGAIEQKKK